MSLPSGNPPRVLYFSGYVSPESGASHALRQTVLRVRAQNQYGPMTLSQNFGVRN